MTTVPTEILWAATAIILLTLLSKLGNRPLLLAILFAVAPFPLSIFGGYASAGNLALSDLVALIGIIALLRPGGHATLGPTRFPIIGFLCVATASSLMAGGGTEIAMGILRMALATWVGVLLCSDVTPAAPAMRRAYELYAIATCALSFCSMYAFATRGINGSMYTLGIHKNSLGSIFGCGVVISLNALLLGRYSSAAKVRLQFSLLLTGVGLMLCLSRGGMISTGVGAIVSLLMSRRAGKWAGLLVALIPCALIVWHLLPEEAADYASNVSTDSYVIRTRLEAINSVMTAFRSSPIFGVGVSLRRYVEPHNVVALALGETGVVGTALFLGMFGTGAVCFARAARQVRNDPDAWPVLITGASVFAVVSVHGLMDVYWRRGVGIISWASVGMAVNFSTPRGRTLRRPLSLGAPVASGPLAPRV